MELKKGNRYNKALDVPHRVRPKRKSLSRPWNIMKKNSGIWVPAVPSWEKDFCKKVGFFTWENFVEAKKYTKYDHKIMDWNDSAGEKAFHNAKNRFFAQINNLPESKDESCMSINDPDLYIDEIDWDDEVCPELLHELERAKFQDNDDKCREERSLIEDLHDIPIHNIKPSGWDVDLQDLSNGRVLTGLIVGC